MGPNYFRFHRELELGLFSLVSSIYTWHGWRAVLVSYWCKASSQLPVASCTLPQRRRSVSSCSSNVLSHPGCPGLFASRLKAHRQTSYVIQTTTLGRLVYRTSMVCHLIKPPPPWHEGPPASHPSLQPPPHHDQVHMRLLDLPCASLSVSKCQCQMHTIILWGQWRVRLICQKIK